MSSSVTANAGRETDSPLPGYLRQQAPGGACSPDVVRSLHFTAVAQLPKEPAERFTMPVITIGIAGPGLSGKRTLLEALVALHGGSVRDDDSRWRWFRQAEVRVPEARQKSGSRLLFSNLGGNLYHPLLEYCREHVPSCDVMLLVLDSQRERLAADGECFDAVRSASRLQNRRGLILYSKQDMPSAAPVAELNRLFNPMAWPWLAAHPGSPETARSVLEMISAELGRPVPG